MTQEQKSLLLKDLCARLPYGVKCVYYDNCVYEQYDGTIIGIQNDTYFVIDDVCIDVENVKPYLIPLSSMTEKQKKEEYEICKYYLNGYESKLIDFYHKNHLDYRGLIPMGLAIDPTGQNIYEKELYDTIKNINEIGDMYLPLVGYITLRLNLVNNE
jgi:hypothetical protein